MRRRRRRRSGSSSSSSKKKSYFKRRASLSPDVFTTFTYQVCSTYCVARGPLAQTLGCQESRNGVHFRRSPQGSNCDTILVNFPRGLEPTPLHSAGTLASFCQEALSSMRHCWLKAGLFRRVFPILPKPNVLLITELRTQLPSHRTIT